MYTYELNEQGDWVIKKDGITLLKVCNETDAFAAKVCKLLNLGDPDIIDEELFILDKLRK